MPLTDRINPELIWCYTPDEVKLGPIHLAYDLEIEKILQGEETFKFKVLASDPKVDWIRLDGHVLYDDQVWRITDTDDNREDNQAYRQINTRPLWYDLGDDMQFGTRSFLAKTPEEGLDLILTGSSWTQGTYLGTYTFPVSMEIKNISLLETIRQWAKACFLEAVFNTATKEVVLTLAQGQERGIGFRYGRNLDKVKRTYKAPFATRIYPLGDNELNISSVNAGVPYIEDFTWYTDQGMTLARAKALHTKEVIWTDTSLITALSLMDAADDRLLWWSRPTVSYECSVTDLSELTGLVEDEFEVGDYVRVKDETFNLDLRTRVVRLIRKPYEPWDNQIELDYLKPGITSSLLSGLTSGGSGSAYKLLVDESTAANITVTPQFLCTIYFTSTGNATGIVGAILTGLATGTGTLTTSIQVDNVDVGDPVLTPFVDGQRIDVGIPTWVTGIADGSHSIDLRVVVSTGSGSVAVNVFGGRLYAFLTGILGGGTNSNAIVNVADVVPNVVDYPDDTPSGWVVAALTTDLSGLGITETLADETDAATDATPTVDVTDTVLTGDSFNRANNAVTLSDTDGAGNYDPVTWAYTGVWGISSNVVVPPTTTSATARVIAPIWNCTVSAKLSTLNTSGTLGILLRYYSTLYWYRFAYDATSGSLILVKNVGGSQSNVYNTSTAAASGDVIAVAMTGTTLEMFKNGTSIGSVTDSSIPLPGSGIFSDQHGLWASGVDASCRLDDFKVY